MYQATDVQAMALGLKLLSGPLHHKAAGWLQVPFARVLGEPVSPPTPAENQAIPAHPGEKCAYDASIDRA